jgi:hypothetical protein
MRTTIHDLNELETQLTRLMFVIADRNPDGAERIQYITESFLEAWQDWETVEPKPSHLRLVHQEH